MLKLAALDMLRVELCKYPPLDRAKPSSIDHNKSSKIFKYCMAYLFDLVVWERLPKIPPGSRRYDALGLTPDYRVDCCSLDYSQCLQVRWYGDQSSVTWADISKFFTMSTIVGAQKRVLAIRTKGKRHGITQTCQFTLPITLKWVTDESIDEICAHALAGRKSGASTTVVGALVAGTVPPPLRTWQAAALVILSAALDDDTGPVYSSVTCGGGKSRLCIELAKARLPCLVFVPARAPAFQFATEINRWAPHFSFAIVDGTHTLPTTLPDFIICPYHSYDKVAHLEFNLCVVDEAHHAQAEFAGLETSRKYANSMNTVVRQRTLLVSATMPADLPKDSIAYTYDLANAVADGIAVDYHLIIPVLDARDSRPGLCRLICDHPEWSKILAYCNTIGAAKEFTEMLLDTGIQARLIEGTTPISERKAVIESLQDGDIRVLVSVDTLGEGVNIPKANTAIFVQPRGSYVDVMQCVGKILRTSPSKTLSYVILPSANEEKDLIRFMRLLQRADSRLAVDSQGRFAHDRVSLIAPDQSIEAAELQCVAVYHRLGQALRGEWVITYDLLREYVAVYGKLPPKNNNGIFRGINLGTWISTQRQAKKGKNSSKQMTRERVEALEAIPGWYWEQDHDATWNATCDLLREYVAAHGKLPPASGKNSVFRGVNLGMWINKQRQAQKKKGVGKITLEHAAALEAIPGWYWEYDFDRAWMATYDLIREYVAKHDRLPPANKNGVFRGIRLGTWICTQRQAKKKGARSMTLERETALEAIPGWYWELDIEETWNATYNLLREYITEHNKLPSQDNIIFHGIHLGTWVIAQRQAKKGIGKMTPNRAAALEAIPEWRWSYDYDLSWTAICDLLREYVAEHDKLPPTTNKGGVYRGVNLGTWIKTQRQARKKKGGCRITLERMATLETIPGWYWDIDEVWMTTCNLLREYMAEHAKIPSQVIFRGVNLRTWVNHQRQAYKDKSGNKLSLERVAALEAIPGWYWEYDSGEAWMATYGLLRAYMAEHDKLPSQVNGIFRGVNLGAWISTQRQAKKGKGRGLMTHERVAALEAIPGWYWDTDETWITTCDLLCKYVAKYDKLPSRGKDGVFHGINLGTWISTQRQAKKGKGGGIPLKRVEALEAIPRWRW